MRCESEDNSASKLSGVEIAKGPERRVVGMSDHDVIENFDFQKLTRPDKITGNSDVRLGRSRIAAWMIVRDDDGGCTYHDCQPKNLPGMTEDGIHRSNGHQVVPFDTPASVENENHQTFTFRIEVRMIGNMRFPLGGCLLWCFALLHGVGCWTFPK